MVGKLLIGNGSNVVVPILAFESFAPGKTDHEPKHTGRERDNHHEHHGNGPTGGVLATVFKRIGAGCAGENGGGNHNKWEDEVSDNDVLGFTAKVKAVKN